MKNNSKNIMVLLCLSFCTLVVQAKNIIYFENKDITANDLVVEVYQNDKFQDAIHLPHYSTSSLNLDKFKNQINTVSIKIHRKTQTLGFPIKNAIIKGPKPGTTYVVTSDIKKMPGKTYYEIVATPK